MNAHDFVARLDKAKRSGSRSWRARCPAHGGKNPSSLLVTEGDDGRILLRCHSQGCSAAEIAGAVGLTLADLMPEKLTDHHCKPQAVPFNPRDVLAAIALEMTVVVVCASDMAKGRTLSENARERLLVAAKRITTAVEACNV